MDWLRIRVRARRALRRAGIAQITQFVWDRGQVGLRENPQGMRAVVVTGFVLTAFAWFLDLGLYSFFDWGSIDSLLLFEGLWISGIIGAILLSISFLTKLDGTPCRKLGIANLVTLTRIALLPTLSSAILREKWPVALGLYIVLALSDVADGILARRKGEETRLGFILDPLADVAFHLVVFLSLYAIGHFEVWAVGMVLIRYAILLFGSIALLLIRGRIWIKPTPFGRSTGVVVGVAAVVLLSSPILPIHELTARIAKNLIGILYAAGVIHVLVIGWINFRRPAQVGYGDWRSWGLPLIRRSDPEDQSGRRSTHGTAGGER